MIQEEAAAQFLAGLRSTDLVGPPLRKEAMRRLSNLQGYNWSGIYSLEGQTLVLDEYVGDPTDHTRIQVGVGVCGTAVAQDANQVVEDVRNLENYLSCSMATRSEIVVLIRRNGQVLGQIDIDGHEVGAFDKSDEAFLEKLAEILADRWD